MNGVKNKRKLRLRVQIRLLDELCLVKLSVKGRDGGVEYSLSPANHSDTNHLWVSAK